MTRIILDTDPGIDDALAIFLALASPEIQLEAITTVSGNVDVEQTTRNALALLTLAKRGDIPVARGSRYPLVRKPVDAAYVHGSNGLGDVALPTPTIEPVSHHAVDLIVQTVMDNPGEITLVAIGPLTNIALAIRREPAIIQHVHEVVLMGGALRVPGNTTPSAEFNIFADPHAAHIVLQTGWPVRIVSLDTTTRTLLKREQVLSFVHNGGPVKRAMGQMLDYNFNVFGPRYGEFAFQMHDPLCLASVFQPDLIVWEESYVDVELEGKLTLGETVGYFKRPDSPPANTRVSVDVDAERFIGDFLMRIDARFP
jgi:inosine-uridine nucleoside N-ribohydrolase